MRIANYANIAMASMTRSLHRGLFDTLQWKCAHQRHARSLQLIVCKNVNRTQYRAHCSIRKSSGMSVILSAQPESFVKRRVAIVAGYNGSDYHGVQLNPNVPTIEDEIRKAMYHIGALRASNFQDLNKIDWSRSSRTDKGVHASTIVFAGKLLLNEDVIDPVTGRVRGLTRALNENLPPNIRIFSVTRVCNSFNARTECALREYEYFLPLAFLSASCITENRQKMRGQMNVMVQGFLSALEQYEGIHDFHNYTRSRSHFYKLHEKKNQKFLERKSAAAHGDTLSDSLGGNSDLTSPFDTASKFRPRLPRHRRAVYQCRGSLIEDFYGEPYVKVHITGQAFLLHQIRCMIGGAISFATDAISSTVFEASLYTDQIVRIPIAPAEGLLLRSNSFGGKRHRVSLVRDWNTDFSTDSPSVHRVLLSDREAALAETFRHEVIYREIAAAWKNLKGSAAPWEAWSEYLRINLDKNVELLSEPHLSATLLKRKQQKASSQQRHAAFILQNRLDWMTRDHRRRDVLPKQFATMLCMHFVIAPGSFVVYLQDAIIEHLKQGMLSLDATEQEIISYAGEYGVEKLAREGRELQNKS
uniref:Ubiquitin fusion degradation protein putative n=1 Tax=Albugo laibachii Nc14 TaxID=890382 RepID=F0WUQ6_9STRA|nr:ubiquitin fusion degradation protein putative [Albugo laibachii Nc14]|eukprot:CCA25138.1 ubiquitin fusion degradation protein putative [Albugo laibachii Nc14]